MISDNQLLQCKWFNTKELPGNSVLSSINLHKQILGTNFLLQLYYCINGTIQISNFTGDKPHPPILYIHGAVWLALTMHFSWQIGTHSSPHGHLLQFIISNYQL